MTPDIHYLAADLDGFDSLVAGMLAEIEERLVAEVMMDAVVAATLTT